MVDSTAASLTVKVATPEPLVTPETVVIVEEPPPFASVTVLPGTGFDCASFNVTVTVDVVEMSAAMLARRGRHRRLRGGRRARRERAPSRSA